MAYRLESLYGKLECGPQREDILSALSQWNYRVFEVEQPPDTLMPYHTHEEDEVLIILEGRLHLNIEEELVIIGVGDVLTIQAGTIHSAASLDGKPVRLLAAFGEGEELEEDDD